MTCTHAMPYTTRNDALTPKQTLSLDGDHLTIAPVEGTVTRVPLAEIAQVWLSYQPTRDESQRFVCTLVTRAGAKLPFTNREYRGLLDFVRHDAEYSAFVREIHHALRKRKDVTYHGGVGAARHALGSGCLVLGLATALIAVAVMLASMGFVLIATLKIVLIAVMVPGAMRWVARNKPRVYDPRSIPPELLPPVAGV